MFSKEEARLMKVEFWEGFGRYASFYSKKVGEPIKWRMYKTGIKGLELKFLVEKKVLQVILEVNHKNENQRFNIYVELNKYKSIIDSGLEHKIAWHDEVEIDSKNVVVRILIETKDYNFNKRDHWADMYRFMAENMYALQNNLEDVLPILEEKFGNSF